MVVCFTTEENILGDSVDEDRGKDNTDLRFDDLTAMLNMKVFWDFTSCRWVNSSNRFEKYELFDPEEDGITIIWNVETLYPTPHCKP